MKTLVALALGLGTALGLTARAEDKAAPKLEGQYTLVSGKKFGTDADESAKKAEYTITKDKITIKGKDATFVMGYTVDAAATPNKIDLEILEGPDGAKGSKALGIVEKKGDDLKIAYSIEKDKRPADFDGKEGFLFVFKKAK